MFLLLYDLVACLYNVVSTLKVPKACGCFGSLLSCLSTALLFHSHLSEIPLPRLHYHIPTSPFFVHFLIHASHGSNQQMENISTVSFYYFSQLPLELRRMIWMQCLPHRIPEEDTLDPFFLAATDQIKPAILITRRDKILSRRPSRSSIASLGKSCWNGDAYWNPLRAMT